MGLFEQFPYSNFHEMNLNKILERTLAAEEAVAASEAAVLEAAADMAAASAAATNAVNTANAASSAATNAVNTANTANNNATNAVNTANTASNTATSAANAASASAAAAVSAKNTAEALAASTMVCNYQFVIDSANTFTLSTAITDPMYDGIFNNILSGNCLLEFSDPYSDYEFNRVLPQIDRYSYQASPTQLDVHADYIRYVSGVPYLINLTFRITDVPGITNCAYTATAL